MERHDYFPMQIHHTSTKEKDILKKTERLVDIVTPGENSYETLFSAAITNLSGTHSMMLLSIKILILLWLINFAPPLVSYFFEEKGDVPLDLGKKWKDGRRILGEHKTIRGLAAGTGTGAFLGYALGFPLWIGFTCGILSMFGDLCSSFIKRRRGLLSGQDAPGLDQGIEGLFPLLLLSFHLSLSWSSILTLLIFFSIGAYFGSVIYKKTLRRARSAYASYPRPLKPRIMAKEFASCHLQSKFLRTFIHFEDAVYYHLIIQSVFKMLGLYKRGVANALCFKQKNITLELLHLPPEFEGYRILFMSDLHLDGLPGLSERLITLLPHVNVDLCLLGGDYRMATHGSYKDSLTRLALVAGSIKASDGVMAVLGNHDCIEIMEELTAMGVNVLVNDALSVTRGKDRLFIAGVDDPHYYQCENLEQAFQDIPPEACTIFMAHSPELYNKVDQKADLYLAGHTHGGQIQIPPFGPIFTHCSAPRRVCCGSWKSGTMQGYTSTGVGVSGVPVRFNCPGEIVVITLASSRVAPQGTPS